MSHRHPAATLRWKEKMSNHVSFLLEAEAAKRRLAQLFQSEQLGRANHRSTAIVTRDSSRAARTDTKQNSKRKQIWKQQLEVKRRQAPANLH